MNEDATTTLFRPVGQQELELIAKSGWRQFPPRLAGQPFFYPVLTEQYAVQIARDWNTKDANSGFVGYVLKFAVRTAYLDRHEVREAGGQHYQEYWIPAEELDEFNGHLVGAIELIHTFKPADSPP